MDGPDNDTCIALRRTPRSCTRPLQSTSTTSTTTKAAPLQESTHSSTTKQEPRQSNCGGSETITRTPIKSKSRKRVRFSDPGPQQSEEEFHEAEQGVGNALSCSSGLTPMIQRSSLGSRNAVASPSAKRRRHSTPARAGEMSIPSSTDTQFSAHDGEQERVRFPSLRQILSDRVKRRIRRNGLSEEMNALSSEKRQQQKTQEAELARLKASLAAKDAEIERLRDASLVLLDSNITSVVAECDSAVPILSQTGSRGLDDMSTSRLMELEREVISLRQELSIQSSPPQSRSIEVRDVCDESRSYDWTMSARDPFSDEYTDLDMDVDMDNTHMEDSAFGDSTMVDLVCSTPSRRQRGSSLNAGKTREPYSLPTGSFPTPPCTSPTMPTTPCSIRQSRAAPMPMTPSSRVTASVQASLPDPETEAVKAELESLRLELSKITETLDSQYALQTRLSEKITTDLQQTKLPAESGSEYQDDGKLTANAPNFESQLDKLLQTLSDRTAALQHLSSSLSSLGFPGTDATEVISSLTSSLRAARLELEYLTPGELVLPLTSHGAEVLDLVLSRLRDLARKEQEHEQTIDEYHELELSLRKQLSARVDVTDALRTQLSSSEQVLQERNETIADLEVGIDRLKGAAEGYRRDIVELETLVQRMESDMISAADNAEAQLRQKDIDLAELQEKNISTESKLRDELEATKSELGECTNALLELEQKLTAVLEQTELFDKELSAMHHSKKKEIRALNHNHGKALAIRDARVTELRSEIDSINDSLRKAYGTIQKLRVENISLDKELRNEKDQAKQAMDEMKAEMQRVVEMSKGFLATPKRAIHARRSSATASIRKSARSSRSSSSLTAVDGVVATVGDETGLTKPAKRPRRYDSGIGLDEDGDVEQDETEEFF